MRAIVAGTVFFALVAPGAQAKRTCHNLTVTDHVREALYTAHDRPKEGPISPGSIYFGRCGSTRYAIASFSKALADQPEKFKHRKGHRWKDKGDGFEDGCSAGARYPIPKALVKIWGICPNL